MNISVDPRKPGELKVRRQRQSHRLSYDEIAVLAYRLYEEEGRPEQSRDTSVLEKIIDQTIAANPRQVEQYRAGKKTVAGFFVGQVMKASKGQANPQLVNELVAKKLER